MIRVVVVDDDRFARDAIAALVNDADDIDVVAKATDGLEAVTHAVTERPDVVVMDVRMPKLDGVEATKAVINECLTTEGGQPVRIIILTAYHVDEAVYDALRAGASGFLLKDAAPAELVPAIRAVAVGDAWLNPAVTRQLIDEFNARPEHRNARPEQYSATPAQMDQLTPREREVLILLAEGQSNADVARELYITEGTVKTHLANLMKKLEVHEKAQAIIAAYQSGLVQASPRQPSPS
jgi:DNA-binding NarL/FixJ family response regulator